jgi:RNA polymerase sigma-70 factor (ECF subfamily)
MTALELPTLAFDPSRARQAAEFADESDFVEHLKAGDEAAFEVLVRQHSGQLLAVARRFLGCDNDAADAVQDAFISAYQSLNAFAGQSALGTWLHRIVINCCLMRLRSRKRRPTVSLDTLLPTFDHTGHHARAVSAWSDQPIAELANAEVRRQVRECIEMLPDPHRTLLLMRDIEELDTATTAELLGVSVAVVKTRLHRGRQALRTLLEPLFVEIQG